MANDARLLRAIGGEEGCRRLSSEFYARVGRDPALKPLFPGKSLRCATEEFGAFLIQFLGGDEDQTQKRWWLSLRESHARFRIGAAERAAWLRQMRATLDEFPVDASVRDDLRGFFEQSSGYLVGKETSGPANDELATRWTEQRALDDAAGAIADGRDDDAVRAAARFQSRPVVFVGLLARMLESGRVGLTGFVLESLARDRSLATLQSAGRSLLHYAAGVGCPEVVEALLRCGANADLRDAGDHTPLYRVANQCASESGPEVVAVLVRAGADVNARNGVTGATALHMAARRGHVGVAKALLDFGAELSPRDRKGDTPMQRARNCRKPAMIELLRERGARG